MGKIIGLLNQKGGVGKSTLAMHLAMALYHNLNFKKESNFVALYDSDNPQYSIDAIRNEEASLLKLALEDGNNFYSSKVQNIYKNDFVPINIYKGDIQDVTSKIDLLKSNYEYTIIDVVGTVNTEGYNEDFIKIFDYIIVPTSTEFDVVRSTISFVASVIAPISANSDMNYGIVLNNVDSVASGTYNMLINDLKTNGFNVLDNVINRRKKYVSLYLRDGNKGLLSTLYPNYDKPIIGLMEEILKNINKNKNEKE
ncbi:ParA family protein [Flavobacterium sp. GSB-24]|uniref:ParA family protein n=1 Tax=Flavobacterium sp. GSB-24 TaxID=2994319 RepID=UPI0024903296|nr:ParA family protein [Flavobacterium sp. GSB-24]BDU27680.1 conjugal transfer protein TraA [Flavobacterium sp. GSB-24]